MKTIDSGEQLLLSSGMTTLASALRITRRDGLVLGFTSHDIDITISSQLYDSSPGVNVSSISGSAGFAVDNLELSTLDDGTVFDIADIFNGLWRNAEFLIFRYNWVTGNVVEDLMAGTIGEASVRLSTIVIEMRGLQQYLQQPIGTVSTKTCRNRLGDARCGVDLYPYTFSGTVTGVTSNYVFTAAGLAQAADYFGEGLIEWLSGDNAGMQSKVRAHAGGCVITQSLPTFRPIQVGDTFSIIRGCRKRVVDCQGFSNILRMRAEPHRPSIDKLTKPPRPSV